MFAFVPDKAECNNKWEWRVEGGTRGSEGMFLSHGESAYIICRGN